MTSVKPTYPANVDFIVQRMKDKGFSRNKLVQKAPTTHATLRSILDKGGRAFLATYEKLANPHALDVKELSQLYIDDDSPSAPIPSDESDRTEAELFSEEVYSTFDETDDLELLLKMIAKVIRARRPIKVISIVISSLRLRLSFDSDDIPELLLAFLRGDLGRFRYDVAAALSIDEITIPAEYAGTIEHMLIETPDSEFSRTFAPYFSETEFDQLQREGLDLDMTRRSDGALVFTTKPIGAA
jgi:hypothetical protein